LAKDIVEAKTTAKVVQFGRKEVQLLHEKDSFIEHTRDIGLAIPETEIVKDKDGIIDFLRSRGGLRAQDDGKKFIVKPIGVDDIARFDMPLLPLETEAATLQRIASIPFKNNTKGPHYIVQEFIVGQELCTHALIVRGQVRAFVSCPSAGVLMHYEALPTESRLNQLMLDFTKRQAEVYGEDFTGHMSFDFLARREGEKGELQIYPIECNPRVHTAIVLFNDTPELVDQYLAVLSASEPTGLDEPLAPKNPQRYYWVGQDLVELVLYPLYEAVFQGTVKLSEVRHSTSLFISHILYWKDGTFEAWDPYPWFWLYHVQWPILFAQYLFKGRWSKLNVSTGKAFKA
jgi:catechol O-methyltransferase